MNLDQPSLRVATADDAPRILTLMKESAAALFPRFYDARQTASAVRHVAQVDPMLIDDGTYDVHGGRPVRSSRAVDGAGGTSCSTPVRRGGSRRRRLLDPATRAGPDPGDVRPRGLDPAWSRTSHLDRLCPIALPCAPRGSPSSH